MNDPAILVVDDNPDHLELIVMALEDCCSAQDVLTFSEGTQVLDYLFARGAHAHRGTLPRPQLVILDLKMVRMDGLEVLRAIRGDPRTATLPVVVHSSSVEKEDVARSYASGASGYLRKATSFDELRQKMRSLHEFWLCSNRPDPARAPTDAADPAASA